VKEYDGQLSFEGGIDSGNAPSIIAPNQLSWAVNTTMRGGFATHRPPFLRRRITFEDDDVLELFSTGLFQGSTVFQGPNCSISLIAAISGHMVKIQLGTSIQASDISDQSDLNNSTQPHVWFQQAEEFLVIQDSRDVPQIYDGASIRRSDVANHEVPTGGPMAYGKGRLWVATGKSYVGGDIVGGDGTTESVLKFTENTFLNEGGSFYVPSQQGDCSPITSMAFGSNIDTSLGEGDLLVFTANSIFAFDAPADRTVWKDLNYPIQRFALLDYGSLSHESVTTVNGDLFFRAQDGIRSFIFARRDFTQSWANTPISKEVNRAIRYDSDHLLFASSAANFDNRMLMTVGPTQHARGVIHRGFAVLDFDLVSSARGKTSPAWEGVWTGVSILQVHRFRLNGKQVCMFFGVDETGAIGLWEIMKSGEFDDGVVPIQWIMETRSFDYTAPMKRKRLQQCETWIDSVIGELDLTTRFRSDARECWTHWHDYNTCVDRGSCDSDEDYCGIRPLVPGVRNRVSTPIASDSVDADGPVSVGYEHQVRLEITGSARLRRLRVSAESVSDDMGGDIGV
jgi:hypothetical protein